MSLRATHDFTEHEEIWLVLPWLANGRLPEALRERALLHVQGCGACSGELDLQRQLSEALAAPERVSYASSASLVKLMRRIERASCADTRALQGHASQQRTVRLWRPPGLAWAATCLLAAGLAGGLAYRELTPAYQVRTDAHPAAAGVVHVIFVHTLDVDQMQALLRANGAQLAEGPTGEANVFGVRPIRSAGNAALQRLATQLRNDPRVRWVEPLAMLPEPAPSSGDTPSGHP